MLSDDRPVHDWYRFVLSFPPHLVRQYIDRLGVARSQTVLDPFCGTGTTLVECKKAGYRTVGIERNPMAHFASAVKVDWSADPDQLIQCAAEVGATANDRLSADGYGDWHGLPLAGRNGPRSMPTRSLEAGQAKLLLKNSISPVPMHKALVVRDILDRLPTGPVQRHGRLALAAGLVREIGNLRFGPEVGIGRIKDDAPVVDIWRKRMREMSADLRTVEAMRHVPAEVMRGDAREAGRVLPPGSVDAVVTSPPYPNEKDYTRTTRLELVMLGLVNSVEDLRSLKRGMVRSNTRGVYKVDDDDSAVATHPGINDIANEIERRRMAMGKTSGFERTYARVVKLYFGGMARHFASLRSVLRPGAKLAYVVGDQASYLRVMIRTGQLLAGIAESLGYEVNGD